MRFAFNNKGKEHPNGGSQLFSATIKRYSKLFLLVCLINKDQIIHINHRMLIEDPNDRIKAQKLYEDLEVINQVITNLNSQNSNSIV